MEIGSLFKKWGFTDLQIKTPVLELDWKPSTTDQDAAWDMYVELLTRVATQPLASDEGTEVAALESVYSLFGLTRDTLKTRGRGAIGFSRIAIIVLNQVVRPFTSKWHPRATQGELSNSDTRKEFRKGLSELQGQLVNYAGLLADLADVEDLTKMEADQGAS